MAGVLAWLVAVLSSAVVVAVAPAASRLAAAQPPPLHDEGPPADGDADWDRDWDSDGGPDRGPEGGSWPPPPPGWRGPWPPPPPPGWRGPWPPPGPPPGWYGPYGRPPVVVAPPPPPPLSTAEKVLYAPFYGVGLVLRYGLYYLLVAPFEVLGRALSFGPEGGVDLPPPYPPYAPPPEAVE